MKLRPFFVNAHDFCPWKLSSNYDSWLKKTQCMVKITSEVTVNPFFFGSESVYLPINLFPKKAWGKLSGPPSRKKLWENSVGWFRMKWMEVGKCEDVTDRISHRRKVVALQQSSTPEMLFGESLGIWLTAIGEKWSMLPVYEQKIGRVTSWWCKYS